jgi:hypothetical protein
MRRMHTDVGSGLLVRHCTQFHRACMRLLVRHMYGTSRFSCCEQSFWRRVQVVAAVPCSLRKIDRSVSSAFPSLNHSTSRYASSKKQGDVFSVMSVSFPWVKGCEVVGQHVVIGCCHRGQVASTWCALRMDVVSNEAI